MLMNLIRIVLFLIGSSVGAFGYRFITLGMYGSSFDIKLAITFAASGGLVGIIFAPLATKKCLEALEWAEKRLQRIPGQDMIVGAFGLILGCIIANLLSLPIPRIPVVGSYLPIFINLIFGYLGMTLAIKKKDELLALLPKYNDRTAAATKERSTKVLNPPRSSQYKILDTSVIIDGRIADLCDTGFLEGTLVVPHFVLEELQHIADASDPLKRNRGRRGLDILNAMQKKENVAVQIYERDFEDIIEVDSKLLRLAKLLKGKIVTNDYNLNKVAELHGVEVLNVNELANALKPIVLPGEEMLVQVIKTGKELGQGVAYLDDGTMIVIDGGSKFIDRRIEVLVTSVIQTAAGRMIFAKPKVLEKAL